MSASAPLASICTPREGTSYPIDGLLGRPHRTVIPSMEVHLPSGARNGGYAGVISTRLEITGPVSRTHPVAHGASRTITMPGADPNGQSVLAMTQSAGTEIWAVPNTTGTQDGGAVTCATAVVVVRGTPGVRGEAAVAPLPQAAAMQLTVTRLSMNPPDAIGCRVLIGWLDDQHVGEVPGPVGLTWRPARARGRAGRSAEATPWSASD